MLKDNVPTKVLVGCQAWTYDFWKTKRGGPPVLFPEKTKPAEYLTVYAKIFDTVEVNSSFYNMPEIRVTEKWYRQTPDHFKFSLKMPRVITHDHNLREPSFALAETFLKNIAPLKEKLAILLIQLPGSFKFNEVSRENLENFLKILPPENRFAIEFRSPEWFDPQIFQLLAKHKVALCLGESEFLTREVIIEGLKILTADFMYLRFRGKDDLLEFDRIQRPQDEAMNFWFEQVRNTQAKEAYVYFSNLFEGNSPFSAMNFRRKFGQSFTDPADLEPNRSLF